MLQRKVAWNGVTAVTKAQLNKGVLIMNNNYVEQLKALDIGSAKPTSVPQQTIEVLISTDNLVGSYADAFVAEAYRVNPLRAEQIDITSEEVRNYSHYLLTKRIECVQNQCKDYRKLKAMYIPIWIQYNIAMIGEVVIRDKGLRLVPVMEEPSTMTYDEAIKVSEKIGMLMDDLQVVHDAMPRDIRGDKDVMSTALLAGYVRALEKVEHPCSTYVTAFLGMKLKEEMAFQILYRVQYDDLDFIASALTTQRGLFK